MSRQRTARDVAEVLGERVSAVRKGQAPDEVAAPAPLLPGAPGGVSFCTWTGDRAADALAATQSHVVLVDPEVGLAAVEPRPHLVVTDDPRTAFTRVLSTLFPQERRVGVHPGASVSPEASIGAEVSIGPCAVVGLATLGDRVTIGAGAVIEDGVTMGDDVFVGPNATIGYFGFGYSRGDDGMPIAFLHYGGVVIGNRVDIGANCTIHRGTLADTVIEDDAKVDSQVYVAHNCVVRRGALLIANCVLSGGVEIGERAWVAPNATIREHLTVGQDAVVALAANVVKNVRPGVTVVGSPAREYQRS